MLARTVTNLAAKIRKLNILTKLTILVAGVAAVAIPLVVGTLEAPRLGAQSADVRRPKFEVASIKPFTFASPSADPGRSGGANLGDPGMFRALRVPVRT